MSIVALVLVIDAYWLHANFIQTYFVKLELDFDGNANYIEMGTSQLLSVPYALHAETASSLLLYES